MEKNWLEGPKRESYMLNFFKFALILEQQQTEKHP